jgi:RimJ/RimL family protein N-acetyltransferase
MSRGGKPVIAIPSTARNGTLSRIVPFLTEGSGVVTSRGDVHYVVTEYGIATLRGRSIRERALELIQVAHPAFREQLLDQVRQHFRVPARQKDQPLPLADLGDIEMVELRQLRPHGGSYFLRPLRSSDERRVQEFFYTHGGVTAGEPAVSTDRLSLDQAYALVNVDQSQDVALCIVERQGPREIIHAIGRYTLDDDMEECADIRLVVRAEKREQGMATALLDRIIQIATQRRLKSLIARVNVTNGAMLGLLERSGFVTTAREQRVVTLERSLSA